LMKSARKGVITYEDFNAQDKRQLIARLLENTSVLDKLRDVVFSK